MRCVQARHIHNLRHVKRCSSISLRRSLDGAKRNRGLSAAESPGYSFWVSLKREGWPKCAASRRDISTIFVMSTVILDFAALHRGYEWPRKSETQSRFERSGVTGLFVTVSLKREGWPNGLRLAKWATSTILITSTVILDFAALHRGYEWPRLCFTTFRDMIC